MPWNPADAEKHTKKATNKKLQVKWASVANAVLKSGGDDAAAIRTANSTVEKIKPYKRKKPVF